MADGKWRLVRHTPEWEPAQLRIDAAGNTAPGFICVHSLENGNGPCGGNVFSLDQAIGDHCCVIWSGRPRPLAADGLSYHRRCLARRRRRR
jgi:hypothetical protein